MFLNAKEDMCGKFRSGDFGIEWDIIGYQEEWNDSADEAVDHMIFVCILTTRSDVARRICW